MEKLCKVALFLEPSATNDRKLLRGIAKYSRLRGPWLFYNKRHPFYMTQGHSIWKQKVLPELKKWAPDGIIAHVDSRKAKELLELGVPTIVGALVEREYVSSAYWADNNEAIALMAAEYLLGLGFRNFAYCGYPNQYWSQERCEAFVKRIEKSGFKTHIYEGPNLPSKGFMQEDQVLLSYWLKSLSRPVALMACNDARAQQIIDACVLADLNVPEDVAVLGVDNDDLVCDTITPALSSVALGTEKAGYETAELLHKMMDGKKRKLSRIAIQPTHIEIRQSTDILAIEDPELAKAINFIRTNQQLHEITVDDVVNVTTLARRALEQRFRKVFNRSIYEEIRHTCVERVARMLLETNMPVFQIAANLGFSSSEHIARPFRKEMGMSPKEYRRKCGY
jgi:LacI family transcriptional regulator